MNRHRDVMLRGLLLTALALTTLVLPAAAQEPERGFSLDLFGASIRAAGSNDASSRSLGLRGGYRFSRTWALEGSLSRLDEDSQVWFGDLSAKVYFIHVSHIELYALWGLGRSGVSDGDGTERSTLHAGLGAEIGLGNRVYLRPEGRRRWDTSHADSGGVHEYSLGVGWRF
jgi:hypothetical protein